MSKKEQPNVLLINADHWAASEMGCAGNSVIMTPTLNQLAETGVRFDRFFSPSPVCVPARRSLMTGMTAKHHGDREATATLRMPAAVTMPQAFRNAGYQAYAVGKLHVYPQRDRIGFDDVILSEEARYNFGSSMIIKFGLAKMAIWAKSTHTGCRIISTILVPGIYQKKRIKPTG